MFYGSLAGTSESSIHKATKTDWRRGDKAVNDTGYVTQLLAAEAVRIIERHESSSPLFLMVSFNAPARYQDVPPALRDSYSDIASDSRRNYAAAVTALDSAVGEIMTALERRKLLDNTLIVFHSDNGGALPTRYATGDRDVRNPAADNGSLREGHGSLYEGGMRIPSIVSWRGRIVPKTIVTDPLHVTDLHATLLRLAGATTDPARPLDGVDVWPVIAERQRPTRKDMLLDVEDFRGAIRVGEWKLIVHAALPAKIELFDIANDPEEADNKAATYPDRVNDLLGRLNAYAYDMAPSLFMEALLPAVTPALWRPNPPKR